MIKPRNPKFAILAPFLALAVTLSAAPKPILEMRFNGNPESSTVVNTGSMGPSLDGLILTPDGTGRLGNGVGVSGRDDDRAFDNSAANGHKGSPSRLVEIANLGRIGPHQSFTLCFWQKPDPDSGPASTATKFISGLCGTTVQEGDGLSELQVSLPGAEPVSCGNGSLAAVGWQMIAVTYDGSDRPGQLKVYTASKTEPLMEIANATVEGSPTIDPRGRAQIGNNGRFERAFDGWIDNLRYFASANDGGGVLEEPDLEALRQLDIRNAQSALAD
jgi:hypothetical protein